MERGNKRRRRPASTPPPHPPPHDPFRKGDNGAANHMDGRWGLKKKNKKILKTSKGPGYKADPALETKWARKPVGEQ